MADIYFPSLSLTLRVYLTLPFHFTFRHPYQAMEIFQCEINPMLEKFFEAPEPKQAEPVAANQDMAMTGDDDGEVLTDDLGAAASDEKDNDLDFDNVFNVKTSDKKEENKFSFDMDGGDK